MDSGWLSNAYLIADRPGGTAVFVDSGAPLEPLFQAVDRHGVTVTHLLTTHADQDHIAGDADILARYRCPVVKGSLETGGLSIEALPTPGHKDETTIGREWEQNPFVRVWRGAEPEGTERVSVGGEDATLVVWSPDYDGKGKAWVRYDDGRDAIVGGSRVERR